VNDNVAPTFANCTNGSAGIIELGCVTSPPDADDAISGVGMPSDNCNLGNNMPGAVMASTSTVNCLTTEVWEVSIDDACGNTGSCTLTYTYILSTGLSLSACPGDPLLDGCATQTQIDAAWDIWINGLLNMSASGGCDPQVIYSQDPATLTKPEDCMNGQQVVTIEVYAADQCNQTTPITCSFTVKAPAPLVAFCPGNMQISECLTQADVDNAFAAWIGQFTATGGCNPQGSDLSQYTAPNFCGGTVTVNFTASDDCGRSDVCSATFTVVSGLAVSCPSDLNLTSCISQADVDMAFANWLGQFSTSGGCNPQSTDLSQYYPPSLCGGRVTVIYKAKDICGREASCTATFSVGGPEPLTVSCPSNLQIGSCLTQAQVNSTFATWLSQFSTSGGCMAQSSNLQSYTAPSYCGGSVTVKYYAWDRCGQAAQCSAVFTVEEPAPLVVSCPGNLEVYGCNFTQTDIDAAFDNWIGLFSHSGGCTPQSSNLQNYAPPSICGGSVTVDYYAWDKCGNWDICTAVFTVSPAEEPLQVSCPQSVQVNGCYTQNQINAAFASWIGEFATTGGCNPQSSNLANYSAPDACGGAVTVKYSAWDQCGQMETCMATFKVKDPAPLSVVCPSNMNIPGCLTQAEVDAQFTAWISMFSTSGGCNPQHSGLQNYQAPSACGGSLTIKYYAWDQCGQWDFCSATFSVADTQPSMARCPQPVTLGTCNSQASVNAAFTDWIMQFESSGGCGGTPLYFVNGVPVASMDNITAPPACGGALYINYFVMDDCHRPSSCSSFFTVPEDNIGPNISTAMNMKVECDGNGNITALNNWLANHGGATATDNCGQVNWSNNYSGLTTTCGGAGSATVTFTASDLCGNTSSTVATFTILDTQPPTGNCPQGLSGLTDPSQAPGPDIAAVRAAYSDICSGVQVKFTGTVTEYFGGNCSGFEVRHSFSIRDACGNTTTCKVIHSGGGTGAIVGNCPPGKEDLTCDQGLQPFEADYMATFFTGADGQRVVAIPVDTHFTAVGCEFTLIYDFVVRDNCGNEKECSITYTGFDTTPPVGECPEEPVVVQTFEEIPRPGDGSYLRQFYMDECGELVINELERDFQGGPCTDIRVTITYEVTDLCGNALECFVEYYLPAVQPNLLTCPPDVTNMQCWADVPAPEEAKEVFEYYFTPGSQVTFIGQTVINNFCQFTFQYAYQVLDPCIGTRRICVLTFTGEDHTPPSPTFDGGCPEGVSGLACQEDVPDPDEATVAAGYSDNCSTPFAYLVGTTSEGDDCGNFTVTYHYRVYDDCDNFVECDVTHSGTDVADGQQPGHSLPAEVGATSEKGMLDMTAYPNPAHDKVWLQFEHFNGERAELTIYNVYGQAVLSRPLVLDQPRYQLSFVEEGLASGSYFISVRTEASVIVRTVILARN
ncbi:MAG: T9SS type A sorting domain-containing protein, partial [Phaeodactylibacter sp.]|nr:T9SS type A sorting domain-containing protein [Phaeodactylibacter sp.]